jgi:8-oxo-dGTP pyrophosphatase MutT (NUDIX family)
MDPHVAVAHLSATSADGTIMIGREAFPQFAEMGARGVFVQSDRVRPARPNQTYVDAALAALREALQELGVPEAEIAFVETVPRPPSTGLRYGFQGAYTTDFPNRIWIFTDWTPAEDLRGVVRHEAAHLAFARTHTPEESAGHSGPSEDFARAFEVGRGGGAA